MLKAEKNDAGLYEVEIDGAKYEFEKWGAEDSLSNLMKLSKIVGKPMGLAFGAFRKDDAANKIDFDVLGTAFESLTQSLDEASALALIKKLGSNHVLCDGKKINFNMHYQDRLDHLFTVVYAALEVQYGNFFSAVLARLPLKNKPDILQALRT